MAIYFQALNDGIVEGHHTIDVEHTLITDGTTTSVGTVQMEISVSSPLLIQLLLTLMDHTVCIRCSLASAAADERKLLLGCQDVNLFQAGLSIFNPTGSLSVGSVAMNEGGTATVRGALFFCA